MAPPPVLPAPAVPDPVTGWQPWSASLDPMPVAAPGVAPLFPGWIGAPVVAADPGSGGMAMLGGGGPAGGAGGCVHCFCEDLAEGEADCRDGVLDTFNGGCNSTPPAYGAIGCGQSVCGTYGTFRSPSGSNFRDTDWYRFTVTTTANVTWTATGDVATQVLVLRDTCPSSTVASASGAACTPVTVSVAALAPGDYIAFVASSAFTGVPCGSRYRATLTIDNCCVGGCQAGDLIENEPRCANGYIDTTNGGCNSTPPVYGAIDCGQTVCGSYGTFQTTSGQNFRDTDWYRFTLLVPSNVRWTAVGQARTRLFLLNDVCPASTVATAVGDACTSVTVTATNLAAGSYIAFVGTDAFTGVPCGSRYRATLTVESCCVAPCQPGDLVEGESECRNGYVDTFNGGCNSPTPVYGAIDCGQTVCGTYGTYLTTAGQNFRDTDWYRFTLPVASNVTWTAVGQARTRLFLLNDVCPASSVATAVGNACTPVTVSATNLAAGTYIAFVATDAFTGVPCGARYRATLSIEACCVPPCLPGDLLEGETVCSNGYVDSFNGGCNSSTPVYGAIACGQTVCGTYGTFQTTSGQNFRDTDWYRFTLPAAATVTWTAVGQARTRVFLMNDTCPASSLATAAGNACTPVSVTMANLAAGSYIAFVATDAFTGVPCGSRYRATLIASPCDNGNLITSLDTGCGAGGLGSTRGSFRIGSPDFAFVVNGAEPTAVLFASLGFPTRPLTCGACTLVDPVSFEFRPNVGGSASKPLGIPCDPSLDGLTLDAQWVSFGTSTNPCRSAPGLAASNRLRCTLQR